jgi:DNA-binding CsgD family transcriptional regulator
MATDILIGREAECALVVRLLDEASKGRSGSLVLAGEPGIGKSALLEYAVASAGSEMRTLRVTGLEAASEAPFAALDELLRPVRPSIRRLSRARRQALDTALGLDDGGDTEPVAVAAATLALLATLAEQGPLLCVIDDAHWIDRESAEALTVVAGRLGAEGIVVLFAARKGEGFDSRGLPEAEVGGLAPDAARALLARHAHRGLAADVADRLVLETAGNPLALVELPGLLSDAQLAGRELLDRPLPVAGALERSFVRRAGALEDDARQVLLVAAASDSEELGLILRAANALGVEGPAIEAADSAGLVSIRGWRLRFRHPLVRSAIYQAATLAERRAVHRALADALSGEREADRRAWHRASAALGPDEEVATELERAAASARLRGGFAAQARTLELAARLAPEDAARARRLVDAAAAAWRAGRSAEATQLLDEAWPSIADPVLRANAQELRAEILKRHGRAEEAHDLLIAEAARLEAVNPLRAARLLTLACHLFFRREQAGRALELAERAWDVAGHEVAAKDLELAGTLAWARVYVGQSDQGRKLALDCAANSERTGETAKGPQVAWCLSWLEEYDQARSLIERAVAAHREAGAFGDLAYVLFFLADLEFRVGRLGAAYTAAQEASRLAEQTKRENIVMSALTILASVEAVLGRANDARTHATHALAVAGSIFNLTFVVRANAALGLLELSLGRPREAIADLELVERQMERTDVVEPSVLEWMPDLIEAYIRADRVDEAVPRVERWERWASQTRRVWALAAAARYRGLIATEADFDAHFQEALALHERSPRPIERARTELCYGERLRRGGKRVDARAHLRAALEMFDSLGAVPWSDRTRAELAATGETVRSRDPTATERLTPQELQIALAVGEGQTNREVAASLFLSPKTIEYHLHNVYRKLDVRSRAQLAAHLTREGLATLPERPRQAHGADRSPQATTG